MSDGTFAIAGDFTETASSGEVSVAGFDDAELVAFWVCQHDKLSARSLPNVEVTRDKDRDALHDALLVVVTLAGYVQVKSWCASLRYRRVGETQADPSNIARHECYVMFIDDASIQQCRPKRCDLGYIGGGKRKGIQSQARGCTIRRLLQQRVSGPTE